MLDIRYPITTHNLLLIFTDAYWLIIGKINKNMTTRSKLTFNEIMKYNPPTY